MMSFVFIPFCSWLWLLLLWHCVPGAFSLLQLYFLFLQEDGFQRVKPLEPNTGTHLALLISGVGCPSEDGRNGGAFLGYMITESEILGLKMQQSLFSDWGLHEHYRKTSWLKITPCYMAWSWESEGMTWLLLLSGTQLGASQTVSSFQFSFHLHLWSLCVTNTGFLRGISRFPEVAVKKHSFLRAWKLVQHHLHITLMVRAC